MHRSNALPVLVLLLLALVPVGAAAGSWDPDDVAAAERYREHERERARRYRAERAQAPIEHRRAEAAPARRQREPAASRTERPPAWGRKVGEIVARLDVPELPRWLAAVQRSSERWRSRIESLQRLRDRFEVFVERGPRWPFEPGEES